MKVCPKCGRENDDAVKICTCGEPLIDLTTEYATTKALGDTDYEEGEPRWGSARFNSRMNLILQIAGTSKQFTFDADEVDEIVIGRVDPDSGVAPAIDLTDSEALEKGVSRRHAAIVRRDGSLHIMDLATPNGTYLNGQKLVAKQPRVLRDGDEIRLGHLVLQVTFKRNT